MKFISFKLSNQEKLGAHINNKVLDLSTFSITKQYKDMNDLISSITDEDIKKIKDYILCDSNQEDLLDLDTLQILAPIKKPIHDIICVGLNYKAHYEETKKDFDPKKEQEKKETIYFSKRVSETVGNNGNIFYHPHLGDELDYEVELGIIIGKKGRGIKKEDALNYIFGYTIINDISARNLQRNHSQWYLGKSQDTFTPMGPCITHKSAINHPLKLNISSALNGEVKQDSNTSYLLKNVGELIEEISRGITLEPGDIIATGTPAGVGLGFNPPIYMKRGDTIECEIEGIGKLKNYIV